MNNIEDLKGMVEAKILPASRQSFAADLVSKYIKYGSLSEKQWYWVGRIVEETLNEGEENEAIDVGDFSGVIALFSHAHDHGKLKYPKLKFDLDGMPVQLARAGERSKTPGWIQVTDGGPYGDNTWYGRVSPEGKFEQNKRLSDSEDMKLIIGFLKELSEDPHKLATIHGHKTGNCCFCSRELSAKNSVAVGYGPVCAEKWGLYEHWIMAAEVAE